VGGSSKVSHGGLKEDFVSITKDIAETVPGPAIRMGLAGMSYYVLRNLPTEIATRWYSVCWDLFGELVLLE
jgi:hypothetical protein